MVVVLVLTLFPVLLQSLGGRDMIPVQDLDIQVTLLDNGDLVHRTDQAEIREVGLPVEVAEEFAEKRDSKRLKQK